jgi:type I restriction enzyme R subunit
MNDYNEDKLVQETTADYLRDVLGWESVFAYNSESFGPEGTLGRKDDREVVLTRYLCQALVRLNPGLPDEAYDDAVRQITEFSFAESLLGINKTKHDLLRDGVPVTFRNAEGDQETRRLRVFDFRYPENNHFLAVRELWLRGDLYRRRADLVGFVNGIPLLFMELKNVNRNLRAAYDENLTDYKDAIPRVFHHNAVIVLGNGIEARLGTVSARYEHFAEWKRLEEEDAGSVDMETLLRGVCDKGRFLDLFENFVLFDRSASEPVKIVARNHQYLGVNRAMQAVREREERQGKLGVFWHTQGSGKSYSMVFFTRKVHRKLGANYTFLICTDREDLDTQIYKTFAGTGLVDNDREQVRADSAPTLQRLLSQQHSSYVFTLVQKFHKEVPEGQPYSERDDIIVISDEAHRSQYGELALNMRQALPNAGYIGFTGTPLLNGDEITKQVFGDYVSTYDFQRAVVDEATVPLYYDARGEKLGVTTTTINEEIADGLERFETEDQDVTERLEKELRRDYHIVTAEERLKQVADDFVEHYAAAWETGQAMFIAIDKLTAVRMFDLVKPRWDAKIQDLQGQSARAADDQEAQYLRRQIEWMRETEMAVVVSEEQGEMARFKRWGLDITPHRRLMKEGFAVEGKRVEVDEAFKDSDHPFRIVFVCAMWLTGFDVPSLANLYLDKPLKAHTLMQAIARANRVHEGKNNGLIVDYCGVLKNLRKALATFAGHQGGGEVDPNQPGSEVDPAKPEGELLDELQEAVGMIRGFLEDQGFRLEDVIEKAGFERNQAIAAAKEAVNESDETRKRFGILAREVFKKYKACLTVEGIKAYREPKEAVNIIYKSLEADREKADITEIIQDLREVVNEAIEPRWTEKNQREDTAPYDISRIDFQRLRQEYEKAQGGTHNAIQNLRDAVEKRLQRMIRENPLRTDFQEHYEELVQRYNQEKDQQIIEQTFEDLLRFVHELDKESERGLREGLDEESLAIFDLIKKPELSSEEIRRIKQVAREMLERLNSEKLNIDHWRQKEGTRDAVRTFIYDYLYDETTGLSADYYSDNEVEALSEEVFRHVFQQYAAGKQPIAMR